VTTTRDEQGRDTVYACLRDSGLPWLAPVGRLDKASEGLLLFSNDPEWAARVSGPGGPTSATTCRWTRSPTRRAAGAVAGIEVDGELPAREIGDAAAPGRQATPGWRSCSTKAATGRSAACWRRAAIGAAPGARGDRPAAAGRRWPRALARARRRRKIAALAPD
jgi:hypothetical protein